MREPSWPRGDAGDPPEDRGPDHAERGQGPADPDGQDLALAAGMLMERHRISPDQALALVQRVATSLYLEPAVLAHALVTLLEPHAAPPTPQVAPPAGVRARDDRRETTDRSAGHAADGGLLGVEDLEASVVQAVASADRDGDAAARLLADLTGTDVDRVMLFAVAEDDTLRLLGASGYPADVTSAWRHLPLALDLPMCAAVTQARPFFLPDPASMLEQFPSGRSVVAGSVAWAAVPVPEAGRVVGVVWLAWLTPPRLDAASRERTISAVERSGPLMVRNLRGREPEPTLLTDLMHLTPDPWMVLSNVPAGTAEDLVIEAAAPGLPGGTDWQGKRLLDQFPGLRLHADRLLHLDQVATSGFPQVHAIGIPEPTGAPWDESPGELRIVRSGHRLILTWRSRGGA